MGLSFGMGCALAARLDGSERRAFVMLGDGEIQEGSIWEAAMAATHHELGNLKVILDVDSLIDLGDYQQLPQHLRRYQHQPHQKSSLEHLYF